MSQPHENRFFIYCFWQVRRWVLKVQVVFLSAVFWCATAVAASSLPYENGVLTVDTREFFIGAPNRPVTPNLREWPLHYSDWLGEFVKADPVLSKYRISFFKTGVPAAELIEGFAHSDVKQTIVETDPAFQVPNTRTLRQGRGRYLFYPESGNLKYSVRCGRNAQKRFDFCSIMVVYPYAKNVALIAKRFFPGSLAEIGHTFDDIARRMVEIAICLDVTEKPLSDRTHTSNDILAKAPTLSGCDIDLLF
ncbi:MAG: hypothetical protein AAGA08_11325 [Pseudomonadota bacterium]